MVRITPLGVDPETCSTCGEGIGATKALTDRAMRHVACYRAMRAAQVWLEGGKPDKAKIELDAAIGPIDMDDHEDTTND